VFEILFGASNFQEKISQLSFVIFVSFWKVAEYFDQVSCIFSSTGRIQEVIFLRSMLSKVATFLFEVEDSVKFQTVGQKDHHQPHHQPQEFQQDQDF